MADKNGNFDRCLKWLAILFILTAAFWVGRLTGKPEIVATEKIVQEKIYTLPAWVKSFFSCKSKYETSLRYP